ncbi:MAG: hypothetical protein P1U35_04920 [Cycloclasticus sp.]|nr:hypothetical protein [Cycloclasticus sp.]
MIVKGFDFIESVDSDCFYLDISGGPVDKLNMIFVLSYGDTHFHGVTPLTCPLDVMRKSFATCYYAKEEPKGWTGDKHSTIFKARPDKWAKDIVLMPLEKASRSLKSRIRGIKGVVKRIIK